jgi:PhoPQ-activated pathogenicity-related protein
MHPTFSLSGLRRLASLGLISLLPATVQAGMRPSLNPTALDRYVAKADPAFEWKLAATQNGNGGSVFTLKLTSQEWLTTNEVDRTQWEHWLIIAKPEKVTRDTALLFISGGANRDEAAPGASREISTIAKATGSVVAELKMVPNQPLVFGGDGKGRTEDDLIAYTWDKFLRTGDEKWPARLPMTKAAVRAMDAVTAFLGSEEGGKTKIDKFVVAGASKRGWTTWTTAAVDDRVVAICPIVIDVLNVEASMKHHFQAYGFFAPAVGNYTEHGIMDWIGTPETDALYAIEDPFRYRDRLTMPKLLINACGDQFFLPDSSRFYFAELTGPKFLRYVPNTDHSLKNSDALETLTAWHHLILNGGKFPEFTWRHGADGSLTVTATTTPKQVLLWQAHNDAARDFRIETLGPAYHSTPVESTGSGPNVFTATVAKPEKGWTAYLMEMTFDVGAPVPLKLTTDVRVIPDTLPFPPPHAPKPKGFITGRK